MLILRHRNNPWRIHGLGICGPHSHTAYVVLVLCSPQQFRRRTADGLVEWWGQSLYLFKLGHKVLNSSEPGSSSMIALFQEHGPCLINNDSSTVRLNPQPWNQASNVYMFYPRRSPTASHLSSPMHRLYVDQPIGTGFSYGDTTVESSSEALVDLWKVNYL